MTLCINDESMIPMGTWLAGSRQYDTGVNTSVSNPSGHSWCSRSSIQAHIPESGKSSHSASDFDEYESSPIDERLDQEAASGEVGPDDLDDPWLYTFQVRIE